MVAYPKSISATQLINAFPQMVEEKSEAVTKIMILLSRFRRDLYLE